MALIPDSQLGEDLLFVNVSPMGDYFINNGNKVLIIKNSSIMDITVSIPWTRQCVKCSNELVSYDDITVKVGTTQVLGRFDISRYNGGNMGAEVNFTCIPSTGVKAAVLVSDYKQLE